MIMPFLRLVIIYIVVILGAVLVFNRDSVMPLLGMPWGGSDTEVAAVAEGEATPAQLVEETDDTDASNEAEATAETTTQTPTEPTAAETTQPPKYPTEQTAQPTAPTPRPTQKTAIADAQPTSIQDIEARLDAARSAYWKRDLKGAEALYKSLIADAPNNADIKGELGNLYYGMRRLNEAADMYHKAGLQLIADGNQRQAVPLIGVLQSIAPDKANDLRSRLSQ